MKCSNHGSVLKTIFAILAAATITTQSFAAPATLLFQHDFNDGIPGWTAVQPTGGIYLGGAMLWQNDVAKGTFWEQSNIHTDSASFSSTRTAVMLINDTVTSADFTYSARLLSSDDDGVGLIWGYQNENTFYRVAFSMQAGRTTATGWPFTGWSVDRMDSGEITDLFGAGVGPITFTNKVVQPFDVTISVSGGLFSLTVVDGPTNALPVTNNLVVNQPLPTSAVGKVGMFSWGMQGGGPAGSPSGFRISNLALTPTPLSGTPPPFDFLATLPPNGNTNAAVQWVMHENVNGPTGRIRENGDGQFGANTATNRVDFAASSMVGGDGNWSNYVYSTRLNANDNDGFGLLLRYQNQSNFYRVALRSEATAAGVKQGLSVQKSVNGVFTEIATSAAYIPPNPAVLDVFAAIRDNTLQVIAVNNPGGAGAQSYIFGPFDMTTGSPETVNTGKVGAFAWAMNFLEVDTVKVEEVAGQGLLVSSAFGTPSIPVGLNDFPSGTVLTASLENVVTPSTGVRRILTGWEGSGSVPATGTTNTVTFTLDSLSLLNWKWQTEYELTLSVSGNGQITPATGSWISEGTNVTLTAEPQAGHIFVGWVGSRPSASTNFTITMNGPVTLTAVFAPDSDADGLSDTWENTYFTNLLQNASGDSDGDGSSNADEFAGGTNPGFAETLAIAEGLQNQWINAQRTASLPGNLRVMDFGSGYRGAFEDSNDNLPATNVSNASFQSPFVVVRPDLWDNAWSTNFSAQIEFTVGDDDGNCFYFRFQNISNWYRATLCGGTETIDRPRTGLSVQKCVEGVYSEIMFLADIKPDPFDTTGYKRLRLTVNGTNDAFEVKAIGWQWTTPDFDPASERTLTFTDSSLTNGSIGFGFWGQQSLAGVGATNGIPVVSGALADNIVVNVNGTNVFTETFETAPFINQHPAGWTNAYTGAGSIEASWRMTVDGITQMSDFGGVTTGTAAAPNADADGPILLAPSPGTENYAVTADLHPFDDDGIGLVYDFRDTNNFARILFASENNFTSRPPPGLTVSRKVNGAWSDIARANDFMYTRAQPFNTTLAVNGGTYTLTVRSLDNPTNVYHWNWTDTAAQATNRIGLATWSSLDGHFTEVRAFNLVASTPAPVVTITSVAVVGNNIVLNISRQNASAYTVERVTALGNEWTPVALNQTAAQYSEPVTGQAAFYRLVAIP